MKGAAKRIGKKESPFSTPKRSAEIKEMSFPEFVSVMLFMDSLTTLSYNAATKVLLNFMEV